MAHRVLLKGSFEHVTRFSASRGGRVRKHFAMQFIPIEAERDQVVYRGNICKLGVTFASPVGHLRRTLGSR